jgi:integrase/recombinase XerC
MTEPITFGLAMRAWLDERDDLSPITVASYRGHLDSFARHIGPGTPLAEIQAGHLRGWLRSMDVADSTKNTRMATLRSFFGWAAEPGPEQLIPWDPTRRVRRYPVPQGPPPTIAADDLARVLELAPGRDRVLMVLAVQTGMRRGELAAARIQDYDPGRRRMLVLGKGSKRRHVEVPAEAAEELAAWLAVLGRRSGPLFPSSHRPGHGLAPSTITHIVAEAGRRCGVHLWPHLLRHQALTDAAERGATAWELQRQAGHAYSSTTDRYVHVADGSVAAAMAGRRYHHGVR